MAGTYLLAMIILFLNKFKTASYQEERKKLDKNDRRNRLRSTLSSLPRASYLLPYAGNKKRQFLRRRVVIYKNNLHKLSTEPAFRCSSLKQQWDFFLEKMFNYKIVKYSLLQESYVIQHKKVAEIFGMEQGNVLTLQPQKRKRGTLRGIFCQVH